MKRKIWFNLIITLGLILISTMTSVVIQAQGPGYDLSWWTVDGGGETSSGGGYSLSGTAGQLDAGVLTGGGYILSGGFWNGETKAVYPVFLPMVLKNVS